MQKFYVSWTYSANYSKRPHVVDAATAEDAARTVAEWYSKDFQDRATIYVTSEEPQRFYAGERVNPPMGVVNDG